MKINGNHFSVFITETRQFLDGQTVMGYYTQPLPSPTDEALTDICTRFMAASWPHREALQKALQAPHRSLFGIYGHRAATLSVREMSTDWLLKGLVGAAIANYVIPDRRQVEVSLAVHYHCAQKLGIQPAQIFAEAAHYAAPPMADRLLAFGRRTDVTLGKFGWKELKTSAGVKYKFSWG